MKVNKTLCALGMSLIFNLLLSGVQLHADENVSKGEKEAIQSGVDWENGFIYATGIGFPPEGERNEGLAKRMAQRAAQVDAQRNLIEVIDGIAIDAQTIVKDSLISNDVIRTEVHGFLKGAQTVSTHFRNDRSAKVTIRVALNGDGTLSDILFPSKPKIIDDWEALVPPDRIATGIVFDADEMGLTPSMSPAVYTDDETIVYSRSLKNIDAGIAEAMGLVSWAKDIESATGKDRIIDMPIVIKAKKLREGSKYSTDLVISLDDLKKAVDDESLKYLLRNCKVVIIY